MHPYCIQIYLEIARLFYSYNCSTIYSSKSIQKKLFLSPWQGTPPQAGYPQARMGGGGTQVGYPRGRVPPRPGQDWGGTQLGQQKEYSLHGGRYASCVHAGGLPCFLRAYSHQTKAGVKAKISRTVGKKIKE